MTASLALAIGQFQLRTLHLAFVLVNIQSLYESEDVYFNTSFVHRIVNKQNCISSNRVLLPQTITFALRSIFSRRESGLEKTH